MAVQTKPKTKIGSTGKPSKFQQLVKANKAHCKTGSDATKKTLERKIAEYTKDSLNKGKSQSQIREIVKNNTGCKR